MSEEGQAECKKYGDKMIADREMLNEELTKLGCECFPITGSTSYSSVHHMMPGEIAEMLLKVGVIVSLAVVGDTTNILEYQLVQQNRTRFSLKNLRRFLKH